MAQQIVTLYFCCSMTLTSLYEKKKKQTNNEETFIEHMDDGTEKNYTRSTETPFTSSTSTTKIPWWAHTNKRKRPAPAPAPALIPAPAPAPTQVPASPSSSQKASAPFIGPVVKSSTGTVALKYSQELPQRMRWALHNVPFSMSISKVSTRRH